MIKNYKYFLSLKNIFSNTFDYMFNIFIASHIDTSVRIGTLYMTLLSLEKYKEYVEHIYISMSGNKNNILPDEFNNFNNLTIYYHDKQFYQFEHIEFLVNNVSISDNKKILFLDDDDILIKPPPIHENRIGFQCYNSKKTILPYFSNSLSYLKLWASLDTFRNLYNSRIVKNTEITEILRHDFSGTTCSLGSLKSFLHAFRNNNIQMSSCVDILFVKYLIQFSDTNRKFY